MTDKELIKQEIERLEAYPQSRGFIKHMIAFIDSLPEEPVSEDLEEEIDKIWKTCNPIDEGMGVEMANIHIEQFDDIAKHFAEWQKQKSMQDFLEKAEKYLAPINYTHPHLIDLDEFKQIIETYINTEEVKSDIDFGYYWGMYVEGGGNINNYEVAKYFFELGNKLKEQQNEM